MKRKVAVSQILLAAGAGFLLLALIYFVALPRFARDGYCFFAVALLVFGAFLLRDRRERWPLGRRMWAWLRQRPMRVLAGAGGLALSLEAGLLARRQSPEVDFTVLLLTWLVGVAWFLLAFVPSALKDKNAPGAVGQIANLSYRFSGRVGARLRYQWRLRRRELVVVAALLLVALAVRGIDLEHVPLNLGGDEGTWGMEGLAMFEGGRLANPFAARWFAFPSLSFLAWGLSIRVFGDSVTGLRALSVLIGTASVLTTYLLARELWGRRVAWLSAALLTFAHFHVHFSRLAVNNIADPLFITLSLWLLVRGLRKRRVIYFALAGTVMGLGWYGYFGARLIGVIAAVYVGWRFLAERRFLARHGWSLVVLAGAALVVMAPLLLYYADHPDALAARSRQVSIFASGWLEREQVITGRSATSLLLQQLWKSISAFNYTLDPTFWYHASIPLLDFVSGVLFVAGLVWAMGKLGRRGNGLLLLWFWSAVILGWVITENPPSSMRLVIVGPALALLAGLGLNWLVGVGQRLQDGGLLGGERATWSRVVIGLLVVVAVLNLYYYFGVYVPARVYGNPTAEIATVLSRYLKREDTDGVVYFYAPPVMYWDFGTLRFMARDMDGVDVNQPAGEGQVPEIDRARRAYFVLLPHRLVELEAVRARYPGGFEFPVYSDADGRMLYVLYEVVATE